MTHGDTEHQPSGPSPDVNFDETANTDDQRSWGSTWGLAGVCAVLCTASCFAMGTEIVLPHAGEMLIGTFVVGALVTLSSSLCRRVLGNTNYALLLFGSYFAVIIVVTIRHYHAVDDVNFVWMGFLLYGMECAGLGGSLGEKMAGHFLQPFR